MDKIGIFFGTDTGSTRLIAKTIYKKLGEGLADKPMNINRVSIDDILQYDSIILGTPTYGQGELPGRETGMLSDSWSEVLPALLQRDLSDKCFALYGLGDQDKYHRTFVNGLGQLYHGLRKQGARIIGHWPNQGYQFTASEALENDKFVGLVIDQSNQRLLTEERVTGWLRLIKDEMMAVSQGQVA